MRIVWVGPFKIGDLLADCISPTAIFPPDFGSAYLVTQHPWRRVPTKASNALYVGGNTGKSKRFRTRIGDLLADSFGFFTGMRGHHSGGQSIRKWTLENGVSPLDLHLAWVKPGECHRCLEVTLVENLKPRLNKHRPAACASHRNRSRH